MYTEVVHWNHRIIQDKHGFSIREAFYDQGVSYTENPNEVTAETLEELKAYYEQMAEAFEAPIIVDKED